MLLAGPSIIVPRGRRIAPPVASDDWAARAGAAGVVLADRLGTSTKLVAGNIDATHWLLNDATSDHVTFDSSVAPSGSAGSWKVTVLPTDGSASGNIGIYFGNLLDFGPGDTCWFSFRRRATPQAAWQPYEQSGGALTWTKLCIMSWHLSSSMPNETVLVDTYGAGVIGGYHQNGAGGFPNEETAFSSAANSSDVNSQPSTDRGANPLTGVNPDTGAAWSTWEQQRARYGILYSTRSSPRAENYREGYGDPFTGSFRDYANEWITYTCRVVIGTNWANSQFTAWAAREGQPYHKLFDSVGITLGNSQRYTCLWLLHYRTSGIAIGRNVASRTNNITGATIHTLGNATPTGDAMLEYNASTQRFRFAGSGESFGVTRGFSSSNGILIFNATSGGAAKSYAVVEVNPALLPTSGTVTDTITVADGRPTGYCWYADTIVSTQAINAPGGYAPT